MKIRAVLAALILLFVAARVDAASIPYPFLSGPTDPSQINATINSLVIAINNILSPLTGGPTVSTQINAIDLTAGTTGMPGVIGLQSGADTNAALQIQPNGTGNIILFASTGSTGVLQFANTNSFVAANGLGACPGIANKAPPIGVAQTIQGFIVVQDWIGRTRNLPAC